MLALPLSSQQKARPDPLRLSLFRGHEEFQGEDFYDVGAVDGFAEVEVGIVAGGGGVAWGVDGEFDTPEASGGGGGALGGEVGVVGGVLSKNVTMCGLTPFAFSSVGNCKKQGLTLYGFFSLRLL